LRLYRATHRASAVAGQHRSGRTINMFKSYFKQNEPTPEEARAMAEARAALQARVDRLAKFGAPKAERASFFEIIGSEARAAA
jgi:hypothetical protein